MENTHKIDFNAIRTENNLRKSALISDYDPITGKGCYGKRKAVSIQGKTLYLPITMLNENHISQYTPQEDVECTRISYDFEFWCARCVTIKDKTSARTSSCSSDCLKHSDMRQSLNLV